MHEKLTNDPVTVERTYKSLFQKLSYVMNLTKVKINLPELRIKLQKEKDLKDRKPETEVAANVRT